MDFEEIIADFSQNYIYLQEKNVDLDCIRAYYEKQIPNIKTEEQTTTKVSETLENVIKLINNNSE